ncbi:hypothetical protein HBI25_062380 [Parastagonospora nodorum]|nr:hypothetical protein HBI95_068660 [Parastagonospora nodorum]KAH5061136.1 hypothetical protein HBH96_071650 [Parastagonospora nodorum]KAH5567001.1 hypothetical protein HBI25_062380 [Parastagonospora nodorum]
MGSTRYDTQRSDFRRPRENVVQQGTTPPQANDPYHARGQPLRAGEVREYPRYNGKTQDGGKKEYVGMM